MTPRRFADGTAIALSVLLVFAILAFATTQRWSMTVLQIGAFAIATAWTARMILAPYRLRKSILLAPMAAVVAWAALQFFAGQTVYRFVTGAAALNWSAYFLLFLIALQIFAHREIRERALRFAFYFGFLVALLAILQYFTGGGRIFWIFPTRSGNSFGPFVNPDHYAAFVELILPVALFETLRDRRRALFHACVAGTLYASVIVSASRAGVALVTAEIIVLLAIAGWRGLIGGRVLAWIAAQLVLLIIVFTAIVGWDLLWQRFQDRDPFRYRREMALSTLDMIRERPLLGSGLGTFETVYPGYARFDGGFLIDHAHNDWLEWAAEGGIPFGLVLLFMVLWSVPAAVRSMWGIGILSVFTHSLVDFPMQIPGLAACTWVLLAALTCDAGAAGRMRTTRSTLDSAPGDTFGRGIGLYKDRSNEPQMYRDL